MPAIATLKARTSSSRRVPAKAVAASDSGFLVQLGERVRAARARRGMTRKDLAGQSQVSERYLAQLEAGHGNISVLLLRQIAAALGLALADLLHDASAGTMPEEVAAQWIDGWVALCRERIGEDAAA